MIEVMSKGQMVAFSFAPHDEKVVVISISDCEKVCPDLSNDPCNGIIGQKQRGINASF